MEQEVSEGIPHLVHLCMERDVLYEYMFGLVCCGWYTGAVVLQRVAACCSMLQWRLAVVLCMVNRGRVLQCIAVCQPIATQGKRHSCLQHTITQVWNKRQNPLLTYLQWTKGRTRYWHTAAHYETLRHTATHCITLHHTATQGLDKRQNQVLTQIAFVSYVVEPLWNAFSRCVAVCCSVLQCVAVCCSVLQCVAVRCSA